MASLYDLAFRQPLEAGTNYTKTSNFSDLGAVLYSATPCARARVHSRFIAQYRLVLWFDHYIGTLGRHDNSPDRGCASDPSSFSLDRDHRVPFES